MCVCVLCVCVLCVCAFACVCVCERVAMSTDKGDHEYREGWP